MAFYGWTQLSSTLSKDDLTQNDYKLPAIIMLTAATPTNPSASFNFLSFPLVNANVNEQYYVFMHFHEVEKLAANETRAFNVTVNGKHWYGPIEPPYGKTTTIFSPSALSEATAYLFSLVRTEASTLPPIINAVEVYRVKYFSQSETLQDDGTPFYLDLSFSCHS